MGLIATIYWLNIDLIKAHFYNIKHYTQTFDVHWKSDNNRTK